MNNRPQQPDKAKAAAHYTAMAYGLMSELLQDASLRAIREQAEQYARANPSPRATFEA